MYLHIASIPKAEITQVVEILPRSYIVNVMAADGLTTQGAGASAATVWTKFSENIPVLAHIQFHYEIYLHQKNNWNQ